ncbi:MAG: NYN domain-containing protein [Bacteroidia bacterium]
MINKPFEYIEANDYNGFACIDASDVIGLAHLAETHNIKFVFRKGAINKESAPEEFFFPVGNVVYKIKANGFINLEDFYRAVEKKFPSAEEYYEAKTKGFDHYEEFKHGKSAGEGGKETFDEAKAAGFVKGYDAFEKKYNKYKTNKHTKTIAEDLDSPLKLYEYAGHKGFKSYVDFEKAYDEGYPDAATYNEAISKAFETSDDFFDAAEKGFDTPAEYKDAKEKYINTKKEYDDYRYLKSGNILNVGFDEYQLLQLLKVMENGKKLKLTELRELLITEQLPYKRSFSGSEVKVLPLWYVQKINSEDALHTFLCNSPDVKKFGTYNFKEKTYETLRMNRTKVCVDASNVAHNSVNSKTVIYKNIRLLIQELMLWKFTDITVVADATLRHKAKDTQELERIKKLAKFYEAPSHTSADKFLLEFVHQDKCIIVTNDTFKEWKAKDFWVQKNIEQMRVSFVIAEDKVMLYGIENHVQKD